MLPIRPPTQSTEQIRRSLVEQIAAIATMQPGTLAEEYRERLDADGTRKLAADTCEENCG